MHGDACRDCYDPRLDGDDVRIDGTLWDRIGPAVSFGDDALRCHAKVLMDSGVLAEGRGGALQRDRSLADYVEIELPAPGEDRVALVREFVKKGDRTFVRPSGIF